MEVLASIVKIPFKIFGFLFKHPRLLVIVVAAVFILFGISTCSHVFSGSKSKTAITATKEDAGPFDATAPPEAKAPYCLYTNTRYYYVTRYSTAKDSITLTEFWSYENKKWVKQAKPLTFNKSSFPNSKLVQRSTDKILFKL